MSIENTSIEAIHKIFELQKAKRYDLALTTAKERKNKLKKLLNVIIESQDEICEAVYKDFRKSKEETKLTEIFPVTTEIKYAVRKLGRWMRPKKVKTPLALFGTKNRVMYESIGQSLIISPWNYPFQLAVGPLVSAIAAGNAVILKPSEKSPHTSILLKKLIDKTFPEDELKVVLGDAEVAKDLTSLPFNHIFFTGGSKIGKLVMSAASKNLSKVTLELGGKSPAIVHEFANIKISARRIAWGKFMNAGQTCVAPDYLLVHKSIKEKFIKEFVKSIKELYGEDETLKKENHYCRLIDKDHFGKMNEMLEDAKQNGSKIIYGGEIIESDNFVQPTIIDNVKLDSRIMNEEIFGPLLPVLTYTDEQELFDIVDKNPNPLSIYIFSNSKSFVRKALNRIPAGSSAVNESVIQFANHNLPFGGIGSSGMGKAHGYYGFKTFSNEKSILKQSQVSAMTMLYPPYNDVKKKLIDILIKYL